MDLKDFVKQTLIQITEGVNEAQEKVRKIGGFVSPASRTSSQNADQSHMTILKDGQNVFLISFDVAVTTLEESGGEAGAKLKVASFFQFGASGNESLSNSATNRITFKVPLAFPVDTESKDKMKRYEDQESKGIADAFALE